MRFSYWPFAHQSWEQILASVAHVEAAGWDGVYVADHFLPSIGPDDGPNHECWSLLAGLAAATDRVRLGPLVTGNTYRNPGLLAKQAATVDHISGGRLVLGLGAGWQENEHEAYGFEFGTVKSRLDRLEASCAIVQSLLRTERTDHVDAFYSFVNAPLAPKPIQERLPILIGGGGEQRTLRITARYADEWNIWGLPEVLAAKGAVLAQRCDEIDRDPATITHSAVALTYVSHDESRLAPLRDLDLGRPMVVGTPAEVIDIMGRYVEAGVDEFIIPDVTLPDPVERHEMLDLFMGEVVPHVP